MQIDGAILSNIVIYLQFILLLCYLWKHKTSMLMTKIQLNHKCDIQVMQGRMKINEQFTKNLAKRFTFSVSFLPYYLLIICLNKGTEDCLG